MATDVAVVSIRVPLYVTSIARVRTKSVMASGMMRCAISNVKDKTPSQSSRSCQLRLWGEELLDKSTRGEAGLAAFDRFRENLIGYIRERINHVTKGLKLNSSKRTKIWSDFHQIRLDPSGPMHSS